MGKKKTAKMKNGGISQHKRMAMGENITKMRGGGKVKKMAKGGRTGEMMYSRGYGVDEKSKRVPTMLMDRGPSGMKKVDVQVKKNKVIKTVKMNQSQCVLKRKEQKNN